MGTFFRPIVMHNRLHFRKLQRACEDHLRDHAMIEKYRQKHGTARRTALTATLVAALRNWMWPT